MTRRVSLVLLVAVAIPLGIGLEAEAQGRAPVTFTKDVAPIFYESCTTCHRPGQLAPMSLLSYEDVRPWARAIRDKVESRAMPPWHADSRYGVFTNDRSLRQETIDTIVAWADGGALRGDPADLPPMPDYVEQQWAFGEPDAVFSIPPFTVPEDGDVDYTYFEVPTNFTEDRWVRAFQTIPGDARVVHHVIVYARDEQAQTPSLISWPEEQDPPPYEEWNPGIKQLEGRSLGPMLGGTTVGNDGVFAYDTGTARLVRAGTTLVFEVHYTTIGEETVDETRFGLYYASEPPQTEAWTDLVTNANFVIPAGAPAHKVEANYTFTDDITLLSLLPHAHTRGSRWDYRLVYPDGRTETVLSVPRYDFNWQTDYVFAKPLELPKGTRLETTAYYDNSTANRANPDATVDVRWGDQTYEEMMVTGLTYTVARKPPGDTTTQQQP